jgi:hypothetical protein
MRLLVQLPAATADAEVRSMRLLTYFVVLWRAVIYPDVCQYHDLLLFTSPTMHHAQGAAMAGERSDPQSAPFAISGRAPHPRRRGCHGGGSHPVFA